jgi:DNA-binding MarR family transcriptional regulator
VQSRWRGFLFSHNLTAQQWRVIMLLYNNNKVEVIQLAKMAEEYGAERISDFIKLLKEFTDILGIEQGNEEP